MTGPKALNQCSSSVYPAGVVGKLAQPSSRPNSFKAAATWTSAWVSTPPVTWTGACSSATMVIVVLSLVSRGRPTSWQTTDTTVMGAFAQAPIRSLRPTVRGTTGTAIPPADRSDGRHHSQSDFGSDRWAQPSLYPSRAGRP